MSDHWDKAVEAASQAISRCVSTGEEPVDAALKAALPHLVEAVIADVFVRGMDVNPRVNDAMRHAAARLAKGEG